MTSERAVGGLWKEPGVPHKGWQFVHMEDVGDDLRVCEMCQSVSIRYVHYMEHGDYPQELGVGCICAGHMEDDYAEATKRETAFSNRVKRRERWLTRKWRESWAGNFFLNIGNCNVVVSQRGERWSYLLQERGSSQPRRIDGSQTYPTMDEAKLAAFDHIQELRIEPD